MKNKKNLSLIILILLFLQSFVGIIYFNFNDIKENEAKNIDLGLSDIFIGNYTVPGVYESIPSHQLIKIGLLGDLEHVTGDHNWKGALWLQRKLTKQGN